MEALDGYILSLFRTENPVLNHTDFDKEGVWVCDLLNQDLDLANDYVKYKLTTFKSKMDKLDFLYSSRQCFIMAIEDMEVSLDPNSEFNYYRLLSNEDIRKRLERYKKALTKNEAAINYFIDCSNLECKDEANCFQLEKTKGKKIDLIRILNAIWELKFVELKNGQIPSKELFMKRAGEFFGADLLNYEIDLSQARNNTSVEANEKIFDEMKAIMKKGHYIEKKKA